MELWIRSQDKETLTKVEVLVIEDNMIVDYYQKRLVLGIYKTKERALKVLDEIQHKLIVLCDSMNRHLYVYEMPKE